jgi:peptidoglycan hydrolase-like protein with peptidoglycan-binding domain
MIYLRRTVLPVFRCSFLSLLFLIGLLPAISLRAAPPPVLSAEPALPIALPPALGEIIYQKNADRPFQVYIVANSHRSSVSSANDVGTEDGAIGPETKDALRKFQQSKGIAETGNPDAQTLKALASSTQKQEFFRLAPKFGEEGKPQQMVPQPKELGVGPASGETKYKPVDDGSASNPPMN